MRSPLKYFLFAFLLIFIDQYIKYWVHINMVEGYDGQIRIFGDFFKLHYVTNKGMAFGIELGSKYGKLILTLFRIFATFGIAIYLVYLHKKKMPAGLLWCIAAVLGGAIGNVIDSTFYGVLVGNHPPESSTPWFHGQVIDMFFFDIYEGFLPDWIPFFGGTYYSTPIFNFADASIFCGVVAMLLFQKSFFKEEEEQQDNPAALQDSVENAEDAENDHIDLNQTPN
jgi:signal peptidase II